jgi:hypothetical protein
VRISGKKSAFILPISADLETQVELLVNFIGPCLFPDWRKVGTNLLPEINQPFVTAVTSFI